MHLIKTQTASDIIKKVVNCEKSVLIGHSTLTAISDITETWFMKVDRMFDKKKSLCSFTKKKKMYYLGVSIDFLKKGG